MKKVIVMGATSGIGREIAMIFLRNGYDVGVAGRRQNLLDELKLMSPSHVFTKTIDVSSSDAQDRLHELIEEMGGSRHLCSQFWLWASKRYAFFRD